jgi:transposase
MKDKNLYERILGLSSPWFVSDVALDIKGNKVTIKVSHRDGHQFLCPECEKKSSTYDHRPRQWQHLPTCQLVTIIEADVPRVKCPTHGVLQISVPWAENNSTLTALFECLVIDWLLEATQTGVAERLGVSWDQVDTVRKRAVARGILRREDNPTQNLLVDETSFQKRHEYVSVITSGDTGYVLEVLDGKGKEPLSDFFAAKPKEHRDAVHTISMDMSPSFIGAVKDNFPNWEEIICFDKFHVSQYFCEAVGKVRNAEDKELKEKYGESSLKGTKFDWFRNSEKYDNRGRRWFMELTRSNLKTARAWAIKETAGKIWNYTSATWARKAWNQLLSWISRCRIEQIMDVGKTVKNHLWGIINAIVNNVTNARAESINSRIQLLKKEACGFRNRARFREVILFHFGGLDLYPSMGK